MAVAPSVYGEFGVESPLSPDASLKPVWAITSAIVTRAPNANNNAQIFLVRPFWILQLAIMAIAPLAPRGALTDSARVKLPSTWCVLRSYRTRSPAEVAGTEAEEEDARSGEEAEGLCGAQNDEYQTSPPEH
jgi:hypothetical protein